MSLLNQIDVNENKWSHSKRLLDKQVQKLDNKRNVTVTVYMCVMIAEIHCIQIYQKC